MKSFSVYEPPDAIGDDAALRARLVKDGFAWPALFIPIIWLLWHRMWLVLIGYLVAGALLAAGMMSFGEAAAVAVLFLFGVLFAWEANNLRRWSLDRRGWREAGSAFGRRRSDAEIRYFLAAYDTAQPLNPTDIAAPVARPHHRQQPQSSADHLAINPGQDVDEPPVVGLFPKTER